MAELLRLPAVAANTEEAVLADWPVAENTPFPADLAIATVETEKAVVDVPAAGRGHPQNPGAVRSHRPGR